MQPLLPLCIVHATAAVSLIFVGVVLEDGMGMLIQTPRSQRFDKISFISLTEVAPEEHKNSDFLTKQCLQCLHDFLAKSEDVFNGFMTS